jgi:DNA-binding beta-propeller fold protein YncE
LYAGEARRPATPASRPTFTLRDVSRAHVAADTVRVLMRAPICMHRIAIAIALAIGPARADPAALDSSLCIREDPHDGRFLSVAAPARSSSVTMTDDGVVTACHNASKKDCTKLHVTGFVPVQVEGGPHDIAINPEGTLLLVGGNADSKSMRVVSVKDGSVPTRIVNTRDRPYSCGAGLWLGDYVLAFGQACEEYDSTPFLANGKTGKYIAAFAGIKATAAAIYAATQLDDKRWAIAVSDRTDSLAHGRVVVIDVTTGKVLATADGTAAGGAAITEGAKTRTLDKLPTCHQA